VALLESAQARGLPVTADVAATSLFITDADIDGSTPGACDPSAAEAREPDGRARGAESGAIAPSVGPSADEPTQDNLSR